MKEGREGGRNSMVCEKSNQGSKIQRVETNVAKITEFFVLFSEFFQDLDGVVVVVDVAHVNAEEIRLLEVRH